MNNDDKKAIKKLKSMWLNVGELQTVLDKFPKHLLVGVVGHFGEFYGLDSHDLYEREAYIATSVFAQYVENVRVVEIYFPDIGPEPD